MMIKVVYGIEAVTPDEFVSRLIAVKPNEVLAAAKSHRGNLNRPAKTTCEYLDTLRRQGLTKTIIFLERHQSDI